MLHKSITYTDVDGNEVTEDFWFHIGRDEVIKKSLSSGDEDYLKKLDALTRSRDGKEILETFQDILGDAVGKREGKLLIKNKEIRKHFLYSGAYGQFFLDLLQSPDSGASWISSMLPKDAQAAVREEAQKRGLSDPPTELPNSGVIEGVVVDEPAVAEDRMLKSIRETPTEGVKRADPAINEEHSDDPAWVREMRAPTRAEMTSMTKEDLQLLFKMREAGVISK